MEWSGAVGLEMELMLVEVQTEITNMRNRGNEFHKETENNNGTKGRNQGEQRQVGRWKR
jgi:hypothetical protein